MKKLEKMSLANIAGKLSRKEMKNIMAGSGAYNCCAVIMEFGHPWQDCGLTQSEAQWAVNNFTDPYYHAPYPSSYVYCG